MRKVRTKASLTRTSLCVCYVFVSALRVGVRRLVDGASRREAAALTDACGGLRQRRETTRYTFHCGKPLRVYVKKIDFNKDGT
ncbi:MAG: hypothetical protein V7L29_13785 [Nostoc sp.]|uniref:hypothetical protein n=1 Tax=Nostoc sp. TaxID=1180 RepID=UPI002FF65B48